MDLKTDKTKDTGRQYGCRSVLTCVSLVQVLFWEKGSRQSEAERVRISNTTALLTGLKGSTVYLISVRAQNSAGLGPCSPALNITTKKPRESTLTGPERVLCFTTCSSFYLRCLYSFSQQVSVGRSFQKQIASLPI